MFKIDRLMEQEKITRLEGEKGVQNLARIARLLGYHDKTYFGQFAHNASYGDLIRFLEDNPGAIQAVVDFIRDNEEVYDIEGLDDEEEEEEFPPPFDPNALQRLTEEALPDWVKKLDPPWHQR